VLPTVAAAPEVYVAGTASPVRRRQVAVAVALWAVLLIGIGTIALGAIVLADLLNPHHSKSVTALPGVFLIAVGALVVLPAVVPSRWLTRHAYPGSVEMSWVLWMLWAVLVLGICIAAVGMIGLLDLLNPNHSKTLTAAPSLLVMGLGGLAILGTTLKLLGFGLSIRRHPHAPRSAKFSRPRSRSQRARMQLAVLFGVLGFFAVIIGAARQGSIGWALVAGLAMAVAFGIPVGIAWAMRRGSQPQEPTPAVPPPPPTLTGSITVRPTPFYRWGPPIIFLVMAGAFLSNAYQSYLQGGLGNSWFSWALGLIALGLAFLSPTGYIRVDDSTILFGPNLPLPVRRTFDRRQVALIRVTSAPMSSRTLFLRSDGSTLWSTPGVVWGQVSLRSLADYLGVPYEE
jgi:hypothetical protein